MPGETPRELVCHRCGAIVANQLVPPYISDFVLADLLRTPSCPTCGHLALWQTEGFPCSPPVTVRRLSERGCLVATAAYLLFPFLLTLIALLLQYW